MTNNTDPVRALIAKWLAEADGWHGDDFNRGRQATAARFANELEAALASAPPSAGEVPPEDRFEQFVQAEIARSPDALRELGAYLADVLDEDRFPRANRLLLQLAIEYAPPSAPVDIQPMQRGGGDPANPRDDSDRYCDHCPAGELASAPPSAPMGAEGSSANGGWTITPPSAPVEVEGFDKRFAEMLLGILSDVQDELGFTDEDKLCANGSAEIVSAIRELKERAASAPPSAPVGVEEISEDDIANIAWQAGFYLEKEDAEGEPTDDWQWPNSEGENMFPDLVKFSRKIAALAQQRAACVGCEGKPAPENSPCAVCGQQPAAPSGEAVATVIGHDLWSRVAVDWHRNDLPPGTKLYAAPQQPAGVDEAAAIRAFEEHFQASSDDPYFEGELELWLTAWRKALAAQQQGGRADE